MTRRMKIIIGLVILALGIGGFAAYRYQQRKAEITAAAEAYLYAMPLVLMDVTREETFKHPAAVNAEPNRFYTIPILADARFRTVIRPNVDTLYSTAWLSLGKEPMVLTIPENDGRYHVIQFMDAWTNVFAAPGIRTIGNKPRTFLIAGPDYSGPTPEGMERIDAPTDMVWVLGRIHARGDDDLYPAQVFQRRIDLRPLSRVGDETFLPAMPDPSGRDGKRTEPLEIVRKMDAKTFYARFAKLIEKNPPAKADEPFIRTTLAPLGLAPSNIRAWDARSSGEQSALQRGMDSVWEVLTARADVERSRTPTGWAGFEAVDKIGSYGTDYKIRAGVAAFGLGANLPEDAVYLNASVDGKGQPLVGGKRYRIRFAPGQFPPVKGFWSITLYDREGYLIANPDNRYAIRQFDKLKLGADGSLEILIQPDDPGEALRSNWLPSPRDGQLALSLRAYWPEKAMLERQWMPPAVEPIEGQ